MGGATVYGGSYRGKRRSTSNLFFFIYFGLVLLVVAAGIFFFLPLSKFTALIPAIIGLTCIAYAGLKYAIEYSPFPMTAAVLLNVMRAIFLLFAVSFIFIQVLIVTGHQTDTDADGANYLIVLGAGVEGTEPSLMLQSRLIACADYLTRNPDCVAILSGGQGAGEDISEAECMRRFLEARNIAPERLLLDERSTDTIQNIQKSIQLLNADWQSSENSPDSGFLLAPKVAVLSNEFHLYRAKLIARNEGVNVAAVSAVTPRTELLITYHIREYFSVIKVYLNYLFT